MNFIFTAYWYFTNKCDNEVVQKVEAAVENIVKTTYGREMFDYFISHIEVAHMRDKNPVGYTILSTIAYTNGDIYLGTFTDLEGSLIHELAHIRYSNRRRTVGTSRKRLQIQPLCCRTAHN